MHASFRKIYNYNKRAGIATRYKLEGSVFVPRWEKEIFSDRPGGLPSVLYSGCRVSFPGVKQLGRGVDYPPLLEARLRKG